MFVLLKKQLRFVTYFQAQLVKHVSSASNIQSTSLAYINFSIFAYYVHI